ncbi:DNA polymerase epsilon catalytic subunit A [Verticillium alfalfae VaMs.102]|uniref:DNA polymerase epsilon catalytic subunit n=1 Tax=Verticillium alfalfae (strain VaMs.102 / ATCC MYA-4576 / FGSC 10136) TaxID=526221 RepID=C9SD13_VERA1|nr:DNA polymerase epsilon catalytic subunit A [Verticillium alfalfae VaMs.102]EEY16978.1 DNA polymerase epsilon catalytic subunit A [Verticillium alfalfae VaMs.102]
MPNTSLRRPQKGYRRGGKVAFHGGRSTKPRTFDASSRAEATSADERWERTRLSNTIDEAMGFARHEGGGRRREGWLVNVQPTAVEDDRNPGGRAALDCYFMEDDGATFKATVDEVEEWLKRVPATGCVKTIKRIEKEDLKVPNHFAGLPTAVLGAALSQRQRLAGGAQGHLCLLPAEEIRRNVDVMEAYAEVATRANASFADASDFIVDIREYDVPVPYIRVGKWYFVDSKHGITSVICNEERLAMADPVVMAYDIETSKLPLKFPDAATDQIMMISYMIDGQGFLITNREIVSEDISDFEYTPKPEYPGAFMIFNEKDEKNVIERFFEHIKEARPTVIATYNGDFFDWPFVETRASFHGIDMYQEIGWKKNSEDQYQCSYGVHMDCFHWVNRDSYLPQGSRGLKAVTVAKLGYDPDELDPELMTPYAAERPQTLAEYSVSDAVATYYLYMKYVHPFVFSLCTILPLGGDDTLRKGTGTLCEMLLMVQAYERKIVLPNKHMAPKEAFWDGHLLDSETYVGGHVESIEAALRFTIEVEEKKSMADVENYEEVKAQVAARLQALKETPNRMERPLIYHLDVASMYPNIMTTNRLQPDSMVQESDCAACDFNRPGKTCDRRLPWSWRGEYIPAKRDEYNMIRNALESEKFPGKYPNSPMRPFQDLSQDEQTALIRKRLQMYSQKIYHKIHDSTIITKEAIICQRENPFYINTVRDFRDRRYDYKGKAKVWKGKTEALKSSGASSTEVEAAKKMIILFDSLQLAHKVILNSFYGYVMRKGSRWYSLEMAGVTCLTGATIIQLARGLVERLGRPLELDTDGIWCMLPATFPENFSFKMKGGKKVTVSYPCVMLNHLVHAKFTNHQYQTLVDEKTFKYETHSDNSIFFEVDGPYKAMVLPTSKEEDKNLKKRYAVFNDDGSLAELKGFEVKRRGELKLIKIFQQQIFKFFLEGTTLAECYTAVAKVANRWLDILHSKGASLEDEELMELISENRSMSKTLEEYGSQKSTSITTAKRLADFLGEQMVKDKGLNCKFIICARPKNAPVTERAVPVAIFSAEEQTKRAYLKKWLKEEPADTDPRALLDWDYYLERLGSVIQKLITIPAALQKVRNPVPRVPHPDWLQRRINIKDDKMKQKKMTDMFTKGPLEDITNLNGRGAEDMEDFGTKLLKPKTTQQYADNIQTTFMHQAHNTFTNNWHLLHLKTTETPGVVNAYVLIHAKIHTVKIKVSRVVFLNLKSNDMPDVDIAGCEVEQVNHTLPNGHSSTHLFKLMVPEDVYFNEADSFSTLFNHPSVEGVYEKNLPLNIRAVLQLGNICTVDETKDGVLGKGLDEGFDLVGLMRPLQPKPYLEASPLAYLYISQISAGERQIFGLFSTTTSQAHIVILNKSRDSGQELPNVSRIYADALKQRGQEAEGTNWQECFPYQEKLNFKITQVTTRRKLHLELGDIVKKLRKDEVKPLMLVIQSSQRNHLISEVPVLSEFPVLPLKYDTTDSSLPPLGWQTVAARRLVGHYLGLGSWVMHLMSLARYGDVPLCNLERDDPRFLIDIAYARRLQNNNVVLWWSASPRPDHAGYEKDDVTGPLETVSMPNVNKPGTFASVCIDLEVRNLAINTILTSSLINDLEGADSVSFNPAADAGANADEVISFDNAFANAGVLVLREMVKAWWVEACKGNTMADVMVQHLVRWVESPDSFLYDRALHYYVQMMSRKAFQQLMGDFRKVGSQVIFANSNRLLLQTTKAEVGTAYAYSNYVIKSIKSKPLFHFIDLEIKEYWDYLVWYDEFNYGGKACQEVVEADNQNLETIMHWQMSTFLPERLQPTFKNGQRLTQLTPSRKDPNDESALLLGKSFEKPLKKTISNLLAVQKRELLHPELAGDYSFPVLPGSHLAAYTDGAGARSGPLLELVKSLMQVLSLDRNITLEARLLRKELLAMFDVREFSKGATFQNPSASLKMPQLSCDVCTMARDMDFCRDADLLPDQGQTHKPWRCGFCEAEYDRNTIEERLIAQVEGFAVEWASQDVQCEKCHALRLNEFMEHCVCSGAWVESVSREDILKKVAVYGNVAKFYGLRMLKEVVEGLKAGL